MFIIIGIGGSSSENSASNSVPAAEPKVELESITAVYNGSTEAGVEINDDSDFTVTAKYDDGSTETVEGWTVEEPATLTASQTTSATVKYKDKTTEVSITCSTIDEAAYKAECQSIAYEELARNGDSYIGQKITFRGQIIQVMEGDDFTAYRINVTQGNYGIWDDTIYVQYTVKPGTPRFLEDDIVTCYGMCAGLYTYETVMGANITVPSALVEFMELS
ncbi:hypothetical protein [Faecalicoccus acidiformans]|uniref:hypothetical protein n=1 Tax=Faecalicoccus acidiformans TaxID=915173 RepID=UPI0023532952|nr:hypothetical protein [Faecalicoccus acidiformans]